MTTPVPAQPPHSGYTHQDWRGDVADVLTRVAAISRALSAMDACMDPIGAGRTQRRHVAACRDFALDLMRHGVRFVDSTDKRAVLIHDAIQRAGGQSEVAQEKTYHQD
jgi:hypothetical protein